MSQPRFYTLWAINDRLELTRLCRQLDEIQRLGFDGVVFHPRFYPNQPPYLGDEYLAIVSDTILHAKSLGLEFWIYDENGWPSGTVGGELLRQHPDQVQQWLEAIPQAAPGGRRWAMVPRRGAGVDYLGPELADHFLQMTYERYRTGLRPAAFEHVTTFFCDEPEFGLGHAYDQISEYGAIPWTPKLPEFYRQKYGEDLDVILPLLFFPGDGHRQARIRFWELLTDLFCQSFITPVSEWCRRQGKRFTAHVKGEEHPLFQVPMVGSCHQVFQKLDLPGIDALERYPSGHFFPRQVASAAQQFGDGRCMVECFGGAGWGATPQDLERYLLWLGGHGLTHFVLHLNQYRLTTHAMRDWPPSIPSNVTWREAFPHLLQKVRLAAASPHPPADTLLVTPYRAIMAEYEPRELRQTNIHNASTYPDSPAGRINRDFLGLLDRLHQSGSAYHVSDERTVEQHGRIDAATLHIGHCAYDKLVIPDSAIFNDQTRRLLARCNVNGDSGSLEIVERLQEQTMSVHPIEWQLQPGVQNDFVLEAESSGPSQFTASFEAAQVMELQFEFADDVREVTLNGKLIGRDGPSRCITGANVVRFTCAGEKTPFLALRGMFAVHSRTPYISGPGGTIATNGPFTLEAVESVSPRDLIASGYPFCSSPIVLHGVLELPASAMAIRPMDIHADCVRMQLNGFDGWCWGPDWTVRMPAPLPAGRHKIVIHLTPSTFNRYGPHHHVDGDRPIVSPAQYQYVKNFADRPDAPANTRMSAWHFKPFGIGNALGVRLLTDRTLQESNLQP